MRNNLEVALNDRFDDIFIMRVIATLSYVHLSQVHNVVPCLFIYLMINACILQFVFSMRFHDWNKGRKFCWSGKKDVKNYWFFFFKSSTRITNEEREKNKCNQSDYLKHTISAHENKNEIKSHTINI